MSLRWSLLCGLFVLITGCSVEDKQRSDVPVQVPVRGPSQTETTDKKDWTQDLVVPPRHFSEGTYEAGSVLLTHFRVPGSGE